MERSDVAVEAGQAAPVETEPAWVLELPPDPDRALFAEFLTESREYAQAAEAALLILEQEPDNLEAINTVFRAFHTVKGTSAFLGIECICRFAHEAENLLARMRNREIRCTGVNAELALRATDAMKELLGAAGQLLAGETAECPPACAATYRMLRHPEAAAAPEPAAASAPAPASPKAARTGEAVADASVRVRTDRLDRLIDMVGELVIAHSMVVQGVQPVASQCGDLLRKVTHSGKIVRELQDLSMAMRLVPLRPTFQKMARLVRDLSHKSGREVLFEMSGEDTEIDRSMVDALGDPLVHMIRNAVDHGIEDPEERRAAGKPAQGRIRLSAYHAGGNVVVELRDDGRGLDRDRILRKAVRQGLIESDKGLSDSAVFNFIFEPGFSTAERVTEVSGRGVGMDVVRRSVQALRGRIEIRSEAGRGTTFFVRLPLTMAVTDGMLVRVGAERFILPTLSIQISFRPEPEAISTIAGRAEMVMFRGDLIPIIRLARMLRIEGACEDLASALLVIVDDGERRAALAVDELLGEQQVVAKPLGSGAGHIPGIRGGAILGDGHVGLILDPPGLVQVARGGRFAERAAEPAPAC